MSELSRRSSTASGKAARQRLDVAMVERGLAPTRQRAQGIIMSGAVRVDGVLVTKAGTPVSAEARIDVATPEHEYVSRGALKLVAALESFRVDVAGKPALDVGAATGGFTEVLLKHGAVRVYAVDVGYGQLAWSLRQDPRVVVMERINIRYLESLPELVACSTIDVSFISLRHVLPAVARLSIPNADAIALIKPQFEAGREHVGKGGVVRDPLVHRDVLTRVLTMAQDLHWSARGLIASPITGPAGNREFLAHLRLNDATQDIQPLVDRVVPGL